MIDGTNAKRYGAAMLAADDRADQPEASAVDLLLAQSYRVAVSADRAAMLADLRVLRGFLDMWIGEVEGAIVPSLPLAFEPAETRREWSAAEIGAFSIGGDL